MTFYTDLRDNDAGPLISEFGQTVTLRQIAQSYSPTTGIGTNTPTDTATKAVLVPPGKYSSFRPENVEKATWLAVVSAKELAAASVVPDTHDKVVIGSKEWAIIEIANIGPGGTAVIYKMLLGD